MHNSSPVSPFKWFHCIWHLHFTSNQNHKFHLCSLIQVIIVLELSATSNIEKLLYFCHQIEGNCTYNKKFGPKTCNCDVLSFYKIQHLKERKETLNMVHRFKSLFLFHMIQGSKQPLGNPKCINNPEQQKKWQLQKTAFTDTKSAIYHFEKNCPRQ